MVPGIATNEATDFAEHGRGKLFISIAAIVVLCKGTGLIPKCQPLNSARNSWKEK